MSLKITQEKTSESQTTNDKDFSDEALTPIRRQYLKLKAEHPDAILLFQMGDFYETFDEDARLLARDLGVTLTTKKLGKSLRVPLAGIPCHNVHYHLSKLLDRGRRVAICDQVTLPGGKGLVKREVVRIISPGTILEPALLPLKGNNYLASLVISEEETAKERVVGIAHVDISTGEFAVTQVTDSEAELEIERLCPTEILLPEGMKNSIRFKSALFYLPEDSFSLAQTKKTLLDHFGTLAASGCEDAPMAIRAAGVILLYLKEQQPKSIGQISRITRYHTTSLMRLSAQTYKDLEVFESTHPAGSLLSVIDETVTPMGGRRLRQWLRQPLLDRETLLKRQEGIKWFFTQSQIRTDLRKHLTEMPDIERLMGRVKTGSATPRELLSLRLGIETAVEVLKWLTRHPAFKRTETPLQRDSSLDPSHELILNAFIEAQMSDLAVCTEVIQFISSAISEDPSAGRIVKEGFSAELDRLRNILTSSRIYLADLEARERTKTGIKTLRVSFNKIFGYYIEITRANLSRVPAHYLRKQTLVNSERFITPELKEHETMIANAQVRIDELEGSLFRQILDRVAKIRDTIILLASCIATMDLLSALAEVSQRHNYVCPTLIVSKPGENQILWIQDGRHPVVERHVAEAFVSNDLDLDYQNRQMMLLTGPNMSGKSTYLRQNALIVLLAQMGSFVPASAAKISLFDRIFTRVGLQDDLSRGVSTFLKEMQETAEILHQATFRSLILLDEVGRGTSTRDGRAIAQAVVEYLHHHPSLRALTLFATHFHDLTQIADVLPRVCNFHVTVSEEGGEIVFCHRVVPGCARQSYGIHVAAMAGFPRPVLNRAKELLSTYGNVDPMPVIRESERPYPMDHTSEMLSSLAQQISKLDLNTITPVEALNKLYEIQRILKKQAG